jgi:hypothetical protein
MSRSVKKPYTKSKLYDKSCRCHGGCPFCEGNRSYQHKKQKSLKEELKDLEYERTISNL